MAITAQQFVAPWYQRMWRVIEQLVCSHTYGEWIHLAWEGQAHPRTNLVAPDVRDCKKCGKRQWAIALDDSTKLIRRPITRQNWIAEANSCLMADEDGV